MNPLRLIAILAVGVCLMVFSAYMPIRAAEPIEDAKISDQSILLYSTPSSDAWPQTGLQSHHEFRTLDVFAPNWRGEYSLQTLTYETDFRDAPSSYSRDEEVAVSSISFNY